MLPLCAPVGPVLPEPVDPEMMFHILAVVPEPISPVQKFVLSNSSVNVEVKLPVLHVIVLGELNKVVKLPPNALGLVEPPQSEFICQSYAAAAFNPVSVYGFEFILTVVPVPGVNPLGPYSRFQLLAPLFSVQLKSALLELTLELVSEVGGKQDGAAT